MNTSYANGDRKSRSSGKSTNVYYAILSDGTMLEALLKPRQPKTTLLVSKNGQVQEQASYFDPTSGITYYATNDDVVHKGNLILPTEVGDPGMPKDLLEATLAYLHQYVDADPDYLKLAARFVLFTYVFDKFGHTPYFRVLGVKGTGKSRFLEVLRSICYHATNLGGGVRVANIFRLNEKIGGGTIFIDEANFENFGPKSDLAQILNDGYSRDGSTTRTNMLTYNTETFSTFSPKVIASNMPSSNDGFESRCLSWTMKETTRKEIPLYIPKASENDEAIQLSKRLLGFRLKYYHTINPMQSVTALEQYNHRLRQITVPLFLATWDTPIAPEEHEFLKVHAEDLRISDQHTDEGYIVGAILSLAQRKDTALISEITNKANKDYKLDLSMKNVNQIVRILGFSVKRTNRGSTVEFKSIDLTRLAEKYAFSSNDGEGSSQ